MAVTMEQVQAELRAEEPNYVRAAALGPEVLPFLEQIIRGFSPMLASKATYLASLIHHEQAVGLVSWAAAHAHPAVRVAAAAAVKNLGGQVAGGVLRRLVEDHDQGVRQAALHSVQENTTPEVYNAISALTQSEPDPIVRALARRTFNRLAPVEGASASEPKSSIRAAVQGKIIGDLSVTPPASAAVPKIIGDLGQPPAKKRVRKRPKK